MMSLAGLEWLPLVWFAGLLVFLFGVLLSALLPRRALPAAGITTAVLGSLICAVVGALSVYFGGEFNMILPMSSPLVKHYVGLDALSGFFILLLGIIGGLVSVHACRYMVLETSARRSLQSAWLLTLFCMQLVVGARDGILLIVAWGLMSVCVFFLVAARRDEGVRDGAWLLSVEAHIGLVCLICMFALLGLGCNGNMSFDVLGHGLNVRIRDVVFLLALIGFGSKAGVVPLHSWHVPAHGCAPAYVCALLNSLLGALGIYGLMRVLSILDVPRTWWGWTIFLMGGVTVLWGMVFALVQSDMKKLMACVTLSNIGMVMVGIGLGVLGWAQHVYMLMVIGFAGALLHLFNHAFAASALLLGLSTLSRALGGSVDLDSMGGQLKRLPMTGTAVLTGALAFAGLPPFNLFASTLTLLIGGFIALFLPDAFWMPRVAGFLTIGIISVAFGLAAVCFVKAIGVGLLGCPRTERAKNTSESGSFVDIPAMIAAACCLVFGLIAGVLLAYTWQACGGMTLPPPDNDAADVLLMVQLTLIRVGSIGGLVICLCALLGWMRYYRFVWRDVHIDESWNGGSQWKMPGRFQPTSYSLVEPIISAFRLNFLFRRFGEADGRDSLRLTAVDPLLRYLYVPVFRFVRSISERQHSKGAPSVQRMILWIVVTLFILIVWKLR